MGERKMRGLLGAATIMAGLAGCSGGTVDEAPADLSPGLYSVVVEGKASVTLHDAIDRDDICFTVNRAVDFPRTPLVHLVPDWAECRTISDPPRGNQMSGGRLCRMDHGRRGPGSMVLSFAGSHTADSFEIHGALTHGEKEQQDGPYIDAASGPFTIIGKRIGECP